ncbi:MAG: 4-(cytidine 5'-diphospho)-2-C-methyl-D-erythritol kinase [Ruminococcaceae bacterium]|nr:4-(cytidine 5'-diphospho)-2-C-methyl-D-erythritol kinase [Oscillospiraceae bacterium]
MKATVRANAKINLSLDIVGKRDDDYHLLESVMQSVSLCDTVNVKLGTEEGGITVSTTGNSCIADDHTNTAYRAAAAFFDYTEIDNPGVSIRIKKAIPAQAGLAGGSADAAAVIVALDELLNTRLEPEQLCDIGERVGADVPFCILGGTMLARGTGNILSPLPDLPDCHILICKPEVSVSTAAAYRTVDEQGLTSPAECSEDISEAICGSDLEGVAKHLRNIFERVTDIPEVDSIKERMVRSGALGACMTGSGSAVFGIFDDADLAEDCAAELRREYDEVFLTQPVSSGCEIDD